MATKMKRKDHHGSVLGAAPAKEGPKRPPGRPRVRPFGPPLPPGGLHGLREHSVEPNTWRSEEPSVNMGTVKQQSAIEGAPERDETGSLK